MDHIDTTGGPSLTCGQQIVGASPEYITGQTAQKQKYLVRKYCVMILQYRKLARHTVNRTRKLLISRQLR